MKKIDILKKLRSSGLRPTKQRVEIAKFLFEREKTFHFTVESLNKLLTKKSISKIALATIYNTVHSFKAAGHLSEVEVRGNKSYFDTNVSNHHHFYDNTHSSEFDYKHHVMSCADRSVQNHHIYQASPPLRNAYQYLV